MGFHSPAYDAIRMNFERQNHGYRKWTILTRKDEAEMLIGHYAAVLCMLGIANGACIDANSISRSIRLLSAPFAGLVRTWLMM